MKYSISYDNVLKHELKIELIVIDNDKPLTQLLLPIWRPGRYEAANYAKNITNLTVCNANGKNLELIKAGPSEWTINTEGVNEYTVSYNYFAFRMDAGSSWLDEDQLYINFINCMIYDPERINEPCQVEISIPDHYKVACGMMQEGNILKAKDYYQLVDSPLIASNSLQCLEYRVENISFYVWVQGDNDLDHEKLVNDFKRFSEKQIEVMESFPEEDYHFLIQALPYSFYHGVEHGNSTVITLGPGIELNDSHLYKELLGVSSHELFHAWNILKIRPIELMPYDFSKMPVFPTGYVAEGFTTYYGDLFLARSGVFNTEQYFNELNKLFKRHFLNFGRLHNSVVESSLDLWFDGYQPSAPNKKSSIYVEGAMSALLLDLTIRKSTNNRESLDDVMRLLWRNYGEKGVGYTHENVKEITAQIANKVMDDFFKRFVESVEDKREYLSEMLSYIGCELLEEKSNSALERQLGIKLGGTDTTKNAVMLIVPGSIGEKYFSLKDELVQINGSSLEDLNLEIDYDVYHIKVKRNFKTVDLEMRPNDYFYLNEYKIVETKQPTEDQRSAFDSWLHR
ncbi:MAG: M61 family peptidase [Bacteroidota bacterium]